MSRIPGADALDPIQPVGIDHHVDVIWADEARTSLEQVYNYLDYHFERGGRYCRARSYRDEPDEVTLFGPFKWRGSTDRVEDSVFFDDVSAYLKRRFRIVKTL